MEAINHANTKRQREGGGGREEPAAFVMGEKGEEKRKGKEMLSPLNTPKPDTQMTVVISLHLLFFCLFVFQKQLLSNKQFKFHYESR